MSRGWDASVEAVGGKRLAVRVNAKSGGGVVGAVAVEYNNSPKFKRWGGVGSR